MRVALPLAIVATVATVAPLAIAPAHADPWGPREPQAERHRQRGKVLYQTQQYDAAIREYRAGFELDPWPLFLFNIGQAWRQADRPCEAAHAYSQFVSSLDQLAPDDAYRTASESSRAVAQELGAQTREACERVRRAPPPPADAPPGTPPATSERTDAGLPRRGSWWWSAGVGFGGWLVREDQATTLPGASSPTIGAASLEVGRLLTRRVGPAVRLELTQGWTGADLDDEREVSVVALSVNLRAWMHRAFWLQGGLGLTALAYQVRADEAANGRLGGVAQLEVGAVVARPWRAGLDVVLATAVGAYDDVTTAGATLAMRLTL